VVEALRHAHGPQRQAGEAGPASPDFSRAELAGPPQLLTGGFWASMALLRLANVVPPASELVLRVMPDAGMAAKETVFQREIARQGFPVPAVRLAGGADSGAGGPFLLMDRAPGRTPLGGLDALAAIRSLPALLRGLPHLLARVTVALHALDPAPLRSALAEVGANAPAEPGAFVAGLAAMAGEYGRGDLQAAALWLAGHRPQAGREVIAHGDLHPFNLLVDGDRWALLDWTTALIADPAYDLTFTALMLRHPPLVAPAPLRPVVRAAGAVLARRFLTAYRRAGGVVPGEQALDWYASLHALRALTEVAGWQSDPDGPDHSGHPWLALRPVLAAILRRTTGTPIQ
jgi:aminoglycoside phosphotransferase (APT) family kinase protein